MDKDIISSIESIVSEGNIFLEEPMKKHTTFHIGGPAEVLVKPTSVEQIRELFAFCQNANIPLTILGNGSNVLVGDKGIRGVVMVLLDNFARIDIEGEVIRAQAGALLSKIGSLALNNSLTGFEFAAGIPGTLGGACIMNAGAYGGEMKDVLVSVTAMDGEGNIRSYSPDEMDMSYRNSTFSKNKLMVLEASIKLATGNREDISAYMKDLAGRRRDKQPLELPSAGSTFKRPEGYFAGKLIEDAGLRGYRVGDAAVSDKHCGFVVNLGNATAKDIDNLMSNVIEKVKDKFGVTLEPEVRRIGEFI